MLPLVGPQRRVNGYKLFKNITELTRNEVGIEAIEAIMSVRAVDRRVTDG